MDSRQKFNTMCSGSLNTRSVSWALTPVAAPPSNLKTGISPSCICSFVKILARVFSPTLLPDYSERRDKMVKELCLVNLKRMHSWCENFREFREIAEILSKSVYKYLEPVSRQIVKNICRAEQLMPGPGPEIKHLPQRWIFWVQQVHSQS